MSSMAGRSGALLSSLIRHGMATPGIMTFMVNQDGKIYQADLGPETPTRAKQLQQFSPGRAGRLFRGSKFSHAFCQTKNA